MVAFIIIFFHLFPKQTDHEEGTSYNITRWNIVGIYYNLFLLVSFKNKLTLYILIAWNIIFVCNSLFILVAFSITQAIKKAQY